MSEMQDHKHDQAPARRLPGDLLRAGVIGWPVAHSLSPVMHGYWLRHYGIAGRYDLIPVPPGELHPVFDLARRGELRGFNITLPHKVAALDLVDLITPRAARAGAINTVSSPGPGKLLGDSTDGFGFLSGITETAPAFSPAAGPVVVLGAGGAARSIAAALLDEGAPEVRIVNRSPEKGEAICSHLGGACRELLWTDAVAACGDAALLVNATSLGMTGKAGFDPAFLDSMVARLPEDALVCDIVYTPLETQLLGHARQRGLVAVDGLGMLLHQGRPGFAAWFGRLPEVSAGLRQAVLARLPPAEGMKS